MVLHHSATYMFRLLLFIRPEFFTCTQYNGNYNETPQWTNKTGVNVKTKNKALQRRQEHEQDRSQIEMAKINKSDSSTLILNVY